MGMAVAQGGPMVRSRPCPSSVVVGVILAAGFFSTTPSSAAPPTAPPPAPTAKAPVMKAPVVVKAPAVPRASTSRPAAPASPAKRAAAAVSKGSRTSPVAPAPPPSRRLFEENAPDPHISVAPDGRFRFVATHGTAGWKGPFPPDPGDDAIFPIRQSVKPGDTKSWKTVAHVFGPGERPAWTKKAPADPNDPQSVAEAKRTQQGDFWAPELHAIGKKSVLFFTARDQATGELSIGVAHSDDPAMKSWKSPAKPLIQLKDMGVIDPTYHEENGEHFLVYKTDGNDPKRNAPTELFVQRLSADATALATGPDGKPVAPVRVLRNDPNSWEGINIEAPSVVKVSGWVYMIYSGNMFNTPKYAVGVARARSITTPMEQWEKLGEPILTNDKGPGHGAPFVENGKLRYVFHQWRTGTADHEDVREVFLTDMHVGDDGWLRAGPPPALPGAPLLHAQR